MELKPDPSNPRKHGREQIRALARSVEETSRLAVIQRAQKSRRRPLSVAFCVLNVVLDDAVSIPGGRQPGIESGIGASPSGKAAAEQNNVSR